VAAPNDSILASEETKGGTSMQQMRRGESAREEIRRC
jgi:hypothetical protein